MRARRIGARHCARAVRARLAGAGFGGLGGQRPRGLRRDPALQRSADGRASRGRARHQQRRCRRVAAARSALGGAHVDRAAPAGVAGPWSSTGSAGRRRAVRARARGAGGSGARGRRHGGNSRRRSQGHAGLCRSGQGGVGRCSAGGATTRRLGHPALRRRVRRRERGSPRGRDTHTWSREPRCHGWTPSPGDAVVLTRLALSAGDPELARAAAARAGARALLNPGSAYLSAFAAHAAALVATRRLDSPRPPHNSRSRRGARPGLRARGSRPDVLPRGHDTRRRYPLAGRSPGDLRARWRGTDAARVRRRLRGAAQRRRPTARPRRRAIATNDGG